MDERHGVSANVARDPWPGVLRMPWESGHDVMPLLAFPTDKQAELNALADAPEPPPKWKDIELCQIPSRAYWEWHARRGRYPWERAGGRPGISRALRESVVERDRGVCQLCERQITATDLIHLDHILPHSLGGPTTFDNLQLAHAACNIRKGARV